MIDLFSEAPLYYWTFDQYDDLDDSREGWEFGNGVWKALKPDSIAIRPDSVAFDLSEEWGTGTIRLDCEADGLYRGRDGSDEYEAVRTDTATHTILTGNWSEPGSGGAFILVLPKKS